MVLIVCYVTQATFTDKKFKHVSNSCLDFMKRLLVRDVRYRMSTGTALHTLHDMLVAVILLMCYQPTAMYCMLPCFLLFIASSYAFFARRDFDHI